MTLRLYVALPLTEGSELALPPGAARYAQVRRLQPGDALRLFDGRGSDWRAEVLAMGRSEVRVRIVARLPAAAATRIGSVAPATTTRPAPSTSPGNTLIAGLPMNCATCRLACNCAKFAYCSAPGAIGSGDAMAGSGAIHGSGAPHGCSIERS